ncbi:glycosyltransferase family 39 protein [Rhodoferax sp. PAMC 29310]|uniref:ArnT family glycosyltransferase n=1 Tax=Rhodoferax sp. PAMC 29310 TaxID=2822760 RepID=UPI001F0B547B|nr:phospholipid carrier-dependent glycosyltransferase [Rhodoferax sp. PAMC 29310]
MIWLPFSGTTEPRYAEISRLMAVSGDWITPWFAPGTPFWGKPPLAFWSEALSFKLLVTNEFAARLPSLLATAGSLALIHTYARSLFCSSTAKWALLVYSTCALVYVVAGAVLTDPFLALGTTWAMVAFGMAWRHPTWQWRYGFFVALALGLLAKGPLALVLVGGPLLPWLVLHRHAREAFKKLPWLGGLALMLLLSLPWFILAELKTPGFLQYFIVGEHFLRFIDSGWSRDLYGTAHERMKGAIWKDVLVASFPWGLLGLGLLLRQIVNSAGRHALKKALQDSKVTYLLAWTLFTPVLFTFAGNILWTYVLPALAAFSILLAVELEKIQQKSIFSRRILYALTSLIPLLLSGYLAIWLSGFGHYSASAAQDRKVARRLCYGKHEAWRVFVFCGTCVIFRRVLL